MVARCFTWNTAVTERFPRYFVVVSRGTLRSSTSQSTLRLQHRSLRHQAFNLGQRRTDPKMFHVEQRLESGSDTTLETALISTQRVVHVYIQFRVSRCVQLKQIRTNCSTWNSRSRHRKGFRSDSERGLERDCKKSKNLRNLSLRRHFLLFSNQEISLQRFGNQNRLQPFPISQFSHFFQIASANPENHLARLNLL